MTPKKEGEAIAIVLNSCFWSDELLDPRSNITRDGAFEREQLRQGIIDHLNSDALLVITIALAQERRSRIMDANIRITKPKEAAQNTLSAIDGASEDVDQAVG